MEGGEFYSETLRKIFSHYHKVDIGLYTHGGCFTPYHVQPYTKIGRYCSIAHGVRVFNRDHPVDFKSTHAFFFNSRLGICDKDMVEHIPSEIGNDVWIGAGAIILPTCRVIGDGAVIGAGANVNKNIPPYAKVVGNPSRIVGYRFPKEKIDELLESKWWQHPIGELKGRLEEFYHV